MTDRIHLDQVNLVVGDMEATAAFYRTLGLDINGGDDPDWQPHHRNSRTEGADVDLDSEVFASTWNEGWPGGTGLVLGFRVPTRDDVDRVYDELTAAGHPSQQEPYDAFFGCRYAVVADPDGRSVGIMSPRDPALGGPPPDLSGSA